MHMDAEIYRLLQEIAEKTNSDLILFFIVVAVVLVVFFIPLYAMIMKDRKERNSVAAQRQRDENEAAGVRQDKYMEREKRIIEVVTANTAVMSSLKTTLERDGMATNASLERIHERIDRQCANGTELVREIVQVQTSLTEVIGRQKTMAEDIKHALLIVDNLPRTGTKRKAQPKTTKEGQPSGKDGHAND
jgi:adenylate kinase family enzyme